MSHSAGKVEVIERRRITVTPAGPGGKQPYHFAENLEVAEAEKFLANYRAGSRRLALERIREVARELEKSDYRVVGAAVLLASGRALPALSRILASHALIHAAEGEFFREVFSKACEQLELPVMGIRERDVEERFRQKFGRAAAGLKRQIASCGRNLGPPWTQDQKTAALAALLALASR